MLYFDVWILWLELRIYSQGVWIFHKFENTIHELRLSANINFYRFRYFADFDAKHLLLG